MNPEGKIYFASDFHLGLKAGEEPLVREKKAARWLKGIAPDAKEIYLLGDLFDFWWEYRLVVPKGFTRFLGTVAEITDSGIPVHFFTGNHDMWMKNYFADECGVQVHKGPVKRNFDGKNFHLAHGEGLGSRNFAYKILLSIFRNKPLQVMYSSMHPLIGISIGHKWSLHSRLGKGISLPYLGEDREDLIRYARSILEKENIDFFIFGHRHLSMTLKINEGAVIVFLGDWVKDGSYGVWDGKEMQLKPFI